MLFVASIAHKPLVKEDSLDEPRRSQACRTRLSGKAEDAVKWAESELKKIYEA